MNQQIKNKIFDRLHQEIKENLITKDKACLDLRRLRNESTKNESLFWHNNDFSKQKQEDLEMFS